MTLLLENKIRGGKGSVLGDNMQSRMITKSYCMKMLII